MLSKLWLGSLRVWLLLIGTVSFFGFVFSGNPPAWADAIPLSANQTVPPFDRHVYLPQLVHPPTLINLTNSSTHEDSPVWSPDSSQIAFVRTDPTGTQTIYLTNTDESHQEKFVAAGYTPAWSPDGSKIAFGTMRNGTSEIHVLDLASGQLTSPPNKASEGTGPVWSPDGSKIAFIAAHHTRASTDIRMLTLINGGAPIVTNLTDGPEYEENLVWSPDSSKIAFVRYMMIGVSSEIYVIDADGDHLTNLTNHLGWDMRPNWSPDGTQIAFIRQPDPTISDIYLINADGSNAINLNLPGSNLSPEWSIDGSKIYFVSWRDNVTDIYVVNVANGQLTNLTNDSFGESSFLLSPDGDKLLFGGGESISGPDGRPIGERYYLFIMNTTGSEKTQLINSTDYPLGQAVWAPDGRKVTFVYSDDIYVVEVEE